MGGGFPPGTMSMIRNRSLEGVVSRDKACPPLSLLIRGGAAPLVWLCRPIQCKWQFLLDVTQMKLEEGKVKLLLQLTSLQLCGDVSHLLSRFPLSLSISSRYEHQQQLPSCLDKFQMIWDHVCMRPWTTKWGVCLSWLLSSTVRSFRLDLQLNFVKYWTGSGNCIISRVLQCSQIAGSRERFLPHW